jgi:hypothetical protein
MSKKRVTCKDYQKDFAKNGELIAAFRAGAAFLEGAIGVRLTEAWSVGGGECHLAFSSEVGEDGYLDYIESICFPSLQVAVDWLEDVRTLFRAADLQRREAITPESAEKMRKILANS